MRAEMGLVHPYAHPEELGPRTGRVFRVKCVQIQML